MAREIWVSGPEIDLRLSNVRVGTEQALIGIIDTGASVICMDRRVAVALGLDSVNRKLMQIADGSEVLATSYMARLRISGLNFDELVEVFAVPMQFPSSRVLLGRSFLRKYILSYNGKDETFHFYENRDSSPEYEEHDYPT